MHNSTIVFTMLQANKQINVPEYQYMFMYVLVSCTTNVDIRGNNTDVRTSLLLQSSDVAAT